MIGLIAGSLIWVVGSRLRAEVGFPSETTPALEAPAPEKGLHRPWIKGFLEFAAHMSGYFDLDTSGPDDVYRLPYSPLGLPSEEQILRQSRFRPIKVRLNMEDGSRVPTVGLSFVFYLDR